MIETPFKKLAQLCKDLESTSKRKKKILFISEFLKSLNLEEVKPATLLAIGALFPEKSDKKLDVGWRTIKRIRERDRQTSLFRYQLTIKGVFETLNKIALSSGEGSRKHKERLLERMLAQTEPVEAEIPSRSRFSSIDSPSTKSMLTLTLLGSLFTG